MDKDRIVGAAKQAKGATKDSLMSLPEFKYSP